MFVHAPIDISPMEDMKWKRFIRSEVRPQKTSCGQRLYWQKVSASHRRDSTWRSGLRLDALCVTSENAGRRRDIDED